MTKLNQFKQMKKGSSLFAVTAVTGLVLSTGGGTVAAMTDHSTQPTMPMSHSMTAMPDHKAAEDLRVAMNNLLREHVTSGLSVTRSIVDKVPANQLEAAEANQYRNASDLAAAVGSIYGPDAQSQFLELFNEHIEQSNKYAMAVAAGDTAAKDAAFKELQVYLHDIAGFFSSAIPGLQEQDAFGLLNEHEELVNKSIEAYKAGDFVQSYQMEREALKQISRAADMLSAGIIASMPTKF